jgi:hypothetical protein
MDNIPAHRGLTTQRTDFVCILSNNGYGSLTPEERSHAVSIEKKIHKAKGQIIQWKRQVHNARLKRRGALDLVCPNYHSYHQHSASRFHPISDLSFHRLMPG